MKNTSSFSLSGYLAVLLFSAAILSYEIWIMRVFAIGNWGHFGSMAVGIAMFGFGFSSVILSIAKNHFVTYSRFWTQTMLLLLGPAMVLANTAAQRLPFNPLFLIEDPQQKSYLLSYFLLYFLPFLFGSFFLGLAFLKGQKQFSKVYFVDLLGAGLGGLAILLAMNFTSPDRLFLFSLGFWFVGTACWMFQERSPRFLGLLLIFGAFSTAFGLAFPQIEISPYKGVSYAKKFPDSRQIYENHSPWGWVQVFASSYLHFAPGLSDNASLFLSEIPKDAYLGMYLDGDGPIGILKELPEKQREYLHYLPIAIPYEIRKDPNLLILQLGGGISTQVGLEKGASKITVAEGNPKILEALESPTLAPLTGQFLSNPKINLIRYDGRVFLKETKPNRFDIIDLSLADSTGLSMPGGFAISEKYLYTEENFDRIFAALKPDGLLSLTVWNREDPPKSTLKLLSTLTSVGKKWNKEDASQNFFITQTYLSTLTVLYKKQSFTDDEIQKLTDYCERMSFEIVYKPNSGKTYPDRNAVLDAYRALYWNPEKTSESEEGSLNLSSSHFYEIFVDGLLNDPSGTVQKNYVFNTESLTNDRPFLAGFIRPLDLPHFFKQPQNVADEWGYLALWTCLAIAVGLALVLLAIPMIFGWRLFFSKEKGKAGTLLYFVCLGLGYMLVELGLVSKYLLCLSNPTVSIGVLITGMLLFSGLGSLFSERFSENPRRAVAFATSGTALVLLAYTWILDPIFEAIGTFSYTVRVLCCLALLAPPAFLMGFPMALGMSTLARFNKERFFIWVWGINGSFSVIGSMLVPIISVVFGLSALLRISALVYLVAMLSYFILWRGARSR